MLANVSFGLLAATPIGWLLMALVIGLESILLSWLIDRRAFSLRMARVVLLANAVSGVAGVLFSLALNRGWWLVVWVPWVRPSDIAERQLPKLGAYLLGAFALSVLLEAPIIRMAARSKPLVAVLIAVLIANALSSAMLVILLGVLGSGAR